MRRILDILIGTMYSRSALYQAQFQALEDQIYRAGLQGQVTILMELDDGEMSIGEKRNRLMRRAGAEFVMYVDDDDVVSDTLVVDVVEAIGDGDVDCISVLHRVRLANGVWQTEEFSCRHKVKHHEGPLDDDAKRTYCIPTSHFCPIRREIALRFPFKDLRSGEDVDQAYRMAQAGVLKRERAVPRPIYWYVPAKQRKRLGLPYGLCEPGTHICR